MTSTTSSIFSAVISQISSFIRRDRMEPPSGFHLFNCLPKELRILIWEYHFEAHRLYVVHPAPESENINPMKEALIYTCTVLDPITNTIIENARPPSPLINREAHEVFQWCKRAWSPVTFNKDLAESVTLPRGRGNFQLSPTSPKRDDLEVQGDPIYIDWGRDMLYIWALNTEQAFWSLRYVPWRNEIRRLALLVPHVALTGTIPFGTTTPIREAINCMQGLTEFFIVFTPRAGTVHSPATRDAIARIRRDIYGFIPYVEYLKAASLAADHMLFNRTFILIREAMAANAPSEFSIERVVDVDSITAPFGHYKRNTHLSSIAIAST